MVWVSQTHLFPSRMDLMGATGQGADRFIRVVISGCPVSQSAVLQLPGLLGSHDGLQVGSFTDTGPSVGVTSSQMLQNSNRISNSSPALSKACRRYLFRLYWPFCASFIHIFPKFTRGGCYLLGVDVIIN